MVWKQTIGQCLVVSSRISVILLNVIPCMEWISLALAIHFCVMFGWIIEQRTSSDEKKKSEWLYRIKLACIYCFYFLYLKNGNLVLRRRIWHSIMLIENIALMPLYLVNSNYDIIVKVLSAVFVILSSLSGVLILELVPPNSEETEDKPEIRRANIDTVESQRSNTNTEVGPRQSLDVPDLTNRSSSLEKQESRNVVFRSQNSVPNNLSTRSSEISSATCNKRETMCSIQDLLANTSGASILYSQTEKTSSESNETGSVTATRTSNNSSCSNTSINEIGLPINEDSVILPGQTYPQSSSCNSSKNTLQNETSKPSLSQLSSTHFNHVFTTVPDHLSQIPCRVTESHPSPNETTDDYESIYGPKDEKSVTKISNASIARKLFIPKSLTFLQSPDRNVTMWSHDYENIPALNVYRGSPGVRHWKPYLDIDTRTHDYSTFKEKSAIQDSTLISSLYANGVAPLDTCSQRPYSVYEKAASNYSVSLPDLSNIVYATREDVEKLSKPAQEHESSVVKSSDDWLNPPNYEAIWYDNIRSNGAEIKVTTMRPGLNINRNGSLINLHSSRMPQPYAFHKIVPAVQRNNSVTSAGKSSKCGSEIGRSSISEKTSRCNSEIGQSNGYPKTVCATPEGRITKKIDSKKTQKSPLMKLISQSQNSIHEHTARAIQVGKKVFNRPRIHVITPKKETAVFAHQTDSLPRIDPLILKRRSQLSPKNKLILTEASALIRKKESTPENVNKIKESKRNSSIKLTPEDGTEGGPQHSTPENNRHLPQMSILSTISSVTSPEEGLKPDDVFTSSSSLVTRDVRRVSGHFTVNMIRCSSKNLGQMSMIEEFDSIPSQV